MTDPLYIIDEKKDDKANAPTSQVIQLGAESISPLITIPNLPTQAANGKIEGDVIAFGEDNLFPYYLSSLIQISPTHAAIIDYKTNAIAGRGVVLSSPSSTLQYSSKKIKGLFKKTSPQLATYEAFAWELITNVSGQVIKINPLPTDSIRTGDYKNGRIQNYYYKQNWNDSGEKSQSFKAWNPDLKGGKNGKFLLYARIERAGQYFYTIPSYFSAWRWISLEDTIGEFHENNIENGFFPSMIIEMFGAEPNKEGKVIFEEGIKAKFSGKGAAKIMAMWNPDPDNATNISTHNPPDLPDYFDGLMGEISAKIMTGHKMPPLLVGVKEKGTTGLGSNSEEIQANFALYSSTTISPLQDLMTESLEGIYEYNGEAIDVEIIPNVPDFEYEAVKGKRTDLEQTEGEPNTEGAK